MLPKIQSLSGIHLRDGRVVGIIGHAWLTTSPRLGVGSIIGRISERHGFGRLPRLTGLTVESDDGEGEVAAELS
jgi:hypothetical protein